MQGVYRIRNKINDKRYVGSAQDFDERWEGHKKELRKGIHANPYLQRAWNKYGEKNFAFEIEEEIKGSRNEAFDREQVYLDKGFELGILYNVARKAGGGNFGEEVNQKISKARKGQSLGPPSEGHKRKLSVALMGHEVTEETRLKIGKGNKGKVHWNKGGTLSNKIRQNMSLAQKGLHIGNECAAKPYFALYNEKTNDFIPDGFNLVKMCRVYDFHYAATYMIMRGVNQCTRGGWRLATPEEIEQYETI